VQAFNPQSDVRDRMDRHEHDRRPPPGSRPSPLPSTWARHWPSVAVAPRTERADAASHRAGGAGSQRGSATGRSRQRSADEPAGNPAAGPADRIARIPAGRDATRGRIPPDSPDSARPVPRLSNQSRRRSAPAQSPPAQSHTRRPDPCHVGTPAVTDAAAFDRTTWRDRMNMRQQSAVACALLPPAGRCQPLAVSAASCFSTSSPSIMIWISSLTTSLPSRIMLKLRPKSFLLILLVAL
jgi:hypothetical protein